jgi:LysM repeat protein
MGKNAESDSEASVTTKEMAEGVQRGPVMNSNFRSQNVLNSSKSHWPPFLFGGIAVLVLVIVLALFLMGREEMNSIKLRLDPLERESARLERLEEKLYRLNRLVLSTKSELEDSLERLNQWKFLLDQRLVEQLQRYYELGRRDALAARESNTLPNVNKKLVPQSEGRYHHVRSGETLYKIARKHGISMEELCRLNDISPDKIIQVGQKLLVASEDGR